MNKITSKQYLEQIKKARALMIGQLTFVVDEYNKRMKELNDRLNISKTKAKHI